MRDWNASKGEGSDDKFLQINTSIWERVATDCDTCGILYHLRAVLYIGRECFENHRWFSFQSKHDIETLQKNGNEKTHN